MEIARMEGRVQETDGVLVSDELAKLEAIVALIAEEAGLVAVSEVHLVVDAVLSDTDRRGRIELLLETG